MFEFLFDTAMVNFVYGYIVYYITYLQILIYNLRPHGAATYYI